MIDFSNYTDEEMLELYQYREDMAMNKFTDSEVVNGFMFKFYSDPSKFSVTFLPFLITEEISKRWVKEKTKKPD